MEITIRKHNGIIDIDSEDFTFACIPGMYGGKDGYGLQVTDESKLESTKKLCFAIVAAICPKCGYDPHQAIRETLQRHPIQHDQCLTCKHWALAPALGSYCGNPKRYGMRNVIGDCDLWKWRDNELPIRSD